MIRQSVIRSSRQLPRLFSTTARTLAEGDTGGTRAAAQSDAFSKREKSNEDSYVRQQERAKLQILKAKLAEQRKNIEELEKDLDTLSQETDAQDQGQKK